MGPGKALDRALWYDSVLGSDQPKDSAVTGALGAHARSDGVHTDAREAHVRDSLESLSVTSFGPAQEIEQLRGVIARGPVEGDGEHERRIAAAQVRAVDPKRVDV